MSALVFGRHLRRWQERVGCPVERQHDGASCVHVGIVVGANSGAEIAMLDEDATARRPRSLDSGWGKKSAPARRSASGRSVSETVSAAVRPRCGRVHFHRLKIIRLQREGPSHLAARRRCSFPLRGCRHGQDLGPQADRWRAPRRIPELGLGDLLDRVVDRRGNGLAGRRRGGRTPTIHEQQDGNESRQHRCVQSVP